MVLLLIAAFCLSIACPPGLLISTTTLSEEIQGKCFKILPDSYKHKSALASLVCGQKLTNENLKSDLSKTSLIHLFVISGSHLILFESVLRFLRMPDYLRFALLAFYTVATGWQPPTARALFSLGSRHLLVRFKCFLPGDLLTLLAGLILLFFFPAWWNSLSLLMSWCASLALCTPGLFRVKSPLARTLTSQFAIWIFMLFPLWGIGSLHPLSLLYNILLAPLISFLLLPLSFLAVAHPWALAAFERVLDIFSHTLSLFSDPILSERGITHPVPLLWMWILVLHLSFHFLRLKFWQGRDCK